MGWAVAALVGLAGATHAQEAPPAPIRKTHTVVVHKTTPHAGSAKKIGNRKGVPVLAPRHPGPVRRPPHEKPAHVTAKPPVPKEAVAKPPAAPRKPPPPADIGTNTQLKLPRYAALKTDEANMRSGPGERYPVIWQYQRHDLPVRIEREYDVWRLVEDMDGIKGWLHQATLTGRRSLVITGTEDRTIRAEASDTAEAVAVLKPGVIVRVKACEAAAPWCQVQVQDLRGWLKRSDGWGIDAGEAVTP